MAYYVSDMIHGAFKGLNLKIDMRDVSWLSSKLLFEILILFEI